MFFVHTVKAINKRLMGETNGKQCSADRDKIPRLSVCRIRKVFPGCLANDDITFSVMPGEIHALLGENGAGKSTLAKVVYGLLHADAGEIRWNGTPVMIASPIAARRLGIGMVFQHFSLFDTLTVVENIALGSTTKARYASWRVELPRSLHTTDSISRPINRFMHSRSASANVSRSSAASFRTRVFLSWTSRPPS